MARSTSFIDLRRITKTVPALDEAEKRALLSFVTILFGLVVTQTLVDIAPEGVAWIQGEHVNLTVLSHLSVVITMTLLSWIGYHQSQQYPPFVLRFFNVPFFMFVADILMVVTYYTALTVAERPDEGSRVVSVHAAYPEALLVLVAFGLYLAWDVFGWLIFRDPEYCQRLQTPRPPSSRFERRRWVTVAFLLVAAGIFVLIACWRPTNPAGVIAVDTVLVIVLFGYRITKQLVDSKVKIRISS